MRVLMKVVIDIPESDYIRIKAYYEIHETMEAGIYYMARGIPLKDLECADCMKECAEQKGCEYENCD